MLEKQSKHIEKGGHGDDDLNSIGDGDGRKRKRDGSTGAETDIEADTDTAKPHKKQLEPLVDTTKKFELAKMNCRAKLSEIIEGQEPVTKSLIPEHIEDGVLIPLKTTLELRDDHQCGQVLITRTPIRSTSAVINLLRDLLPEEIVKGMPHLRRCAKPMDLPAHLKTQFMNDTAASKQIHTGKSNWVYVLLGLEATLSQKEMAEALSKVDGFEEGVFIASIPVPLLAPTSQIQAALWTSQFWPTMYRKNNPLGPHPSLVIRATDEIVDDAPIWMALANEMAVKSKETGLGEAMGACIVYRGDDGPRLVAVAGDARWQHQHKSSKTGNPMAHAVLRAISMVAQKLVRAEKKSQRRKSVSSNASVTTTTTTTNENEPPSKSASVPPVVVPTSDNGAIHNAESSVDSMEVTPPAATEDVVVCQVHNEVQDRVRDRLSRGRDRGHAGHRQRLEFEVFKDKPLLEEEERVFMEEHPTPDGYLCHGLELYVTHEPCTMCSMAILHSRMGKVVFANRMPLTGGLSAEDRTLVPSSTPDVPYSTDTQTGTDMDGAGGSTHGLGLFWRRELNWSFLAWEWEAHCTCKPLDMAPTTHA
ncbi:uncharacterized protein SPSK_08888 [Sporothrix schenckii 1099-18]|nr:uncharacterized protein SPSK_08888 [Sporothrix schenckii 1099-18]KJR85532.1 hypothetical protein SPSK_08888 [Sporothrix schenckii 1099-18]